MWSRLISVGSVLAVLALAACSSSERGQMGSQDDGEEELRTGQRMCGGIAGIRCPSGYSCKLNGHYPDASGRCVKPGPGDEGGMCGGIAGIQCKSGLHCEYESSDDDNSPPPVVMGMPIPRDAGSSHPVMGMPIRRDAGSGPPPGAVGLPIFPDQSGKCVTDDDDSPPVRLGLPLPPNH
jgi:hypothetical protein